MRATLTDGFVQSSRDKGQAVGRIPGYRAQSVWTGSVTGNYFLLELEYSGNKFVSFKRFVWGLGARYRYSLNDLNNHFSTVPSLSNSVSLSTISSITSQASTNESFDFRPLVEEDVKKIVLSMKSTAVGHDEIGRIGFGSHRFGSGRVAPVRFGSGPHRFDSAQVAPVRFGSGRTGSVRVRSHRFGSAQVAPVRFGSGRTGSVRAQVAPVRFGSGRTGSVRVRSRRFGSGQVAPVRVETIWVAPVYTDVA
ncbi:hypothetical protein ACJJTC_011819 [Scirpophaga incertulas]